MIIHALACDYDGTVATDGRIAASTADILARVRTSGRKLLLVTGRRLSDLRRVCPDVDTMFDAVVAENGAVLHLPARRDTRVLAAPPEPQLLEALRRHGVPFDVGDSIVASEALFASAALAAIREAGVERGLVFNKDAVMLLPGGVTKGTGADRALESLALSRHNVAGIGDAENDHAFLALCECAVAVADAVPALRERADHVTDAGGPRGVEEFVERHLLRNDCAEVLARIERHHLSLGTERDGTAVSIPAHGVEMLIVGPSESGKSTITGVLVERLLEAERSVCIIDPEGDHQALGELPGVVVLGGGPEQALPTGEELHQLLLHPHTSLVLSMSTMTRSEKVEYTTKALGTIAAIRAATGLPHWLIVDEAHHVFPADGSAAVDLLRPEAQSLCLTTLTPDELSAAVRALVDTLASTDLPAFAAALRALEPDPARGPAPEIARGLAAIARDGTLERGEIALARVEGNTARLTRLRLGPRRVRHRRHIRKYTEGELPPERSFYFRGPDGRLNLRAANLVRFRELAEGIDETTWAYHAGRGDISAWMRDEIKDAELADEIAAHERTAANPAESRTRVLEVLRRRYAV
jgi:hydroxymethylpyrimidine pyrophosphatase-like HAD family hydrolase